VNDPGQFLAHYYHFVAELFLGLWAFWTGSFPSPAPPWHRLIFAHSSPQGWRDGPGFNAYFLRAFLPSLPIEHESEWEDRIQATVPPPSKNTFYNPLPPLQLNQETRNIKLSSRVWYFPQLLLVDRSAAFRGPMCGSKTQRTASEAWEYMYGKGGKKEGDGKWWEPVRTAVGRFAGVSEEDLTSADELSKVVVTYISRQGGKRRLVVEDHEMLITALEELVEAKNEASRHGEAGAREWELNVVRAETLSRDEQVRIMARTTVGVLFICLKVLFISVGTDK
jgi:hypothetical protein